MAPHMKIGGRVSWTATNLTTSASAAFPNASADSGDWVLHGNQQPLCRYALLLHGSLLSRKKYLPLCAASHIAMVVHPNAGYGGVDVYLHSWSAQVHDGLTIAQINAAYGSALRASLHESSIVGLPKSASQALSIARGAVCIMKLARAAAHTYETVLTMRHDSLVSAPMRLKAFDGAHIWLAQKCCQGDARRGDEWDVVQRSCGANDLSLNAGSAGGAAPRRKRVVRHCMVGDFGGRNAGRTPQVNAAYFVHDWWIAARADVLASWRRIPEHWPTYVRLTRRLRLPTSMWSHFLWPVHLHDALNATKRIRFATSHVSLPKLANLTMLHVPGTCPVKPKVRMARPYDAGNRSLSAAAKAVFGTHFAPMAEQCPFANADAPVVCCFDERKCGDRGDHAVFCEQHRQTLLRLKSRAHS